jgi:tetratricopeptide (TPR) repeat protein
MAPFRRVFGTFLAVFAVSAQSVPKQSIGVACNLLRSDDQRRAGLEALHVGRYAAARQAFQESFNACPAQHGILLELSRVDVQLKDFAGAIRTAQQLLELEPTSVDGRLALANAYLVAQRPQDALREADAVLKLDPAHATALKLKGNMEYLSGNLDGALAAFVTLLDKHPEDEEGPYMLGRIYYQEGRVDHATGQFQRVLKLNPKSYKALDNLGLCYQSLGDTELATRYFLTAIKLVDKDHPEYDWAYANLASLLLDKGEDEKAFAFASKAADRNPNSARNFYLGGKALGKLGKNELCVNWLERSVSLDPNYPEPLYLLGRVYAQLGQQDKAKAALEKFQALKKTAPRQRK